MTPEKLEGFVREHTSRRAVPFVPEVVMYSATEVVPLWEATEILWADDPPAEIERAEFEPVDIDRRPVGPEGGEASSVPPFWAFPWAGGQGLARYVLDHPEVVRGRDVLDLAAGGGLVAIAAVLAGARRVTANEIDPLATAAIMVNTATNGVSLDVLLGDLLDTDMLVDVVLAGDVFYSREMADRMLAFMRRSEAATVLVGDPGRAYAPVVGADVTEVAAYDVPVIRDLEDLDVKRVRVLRIG